MTLVQYQDTQGRSIVPYNANYERDIALGFIGKVVAFPVTAVTIIIGQGFRDIIITATDIGVQTRIGKIRAIYQNYSIEIQNLVYDNSPPHLKEMYEQELILNMKLDLENTRNNR
jgi:hypothetical protein